MEIFGPHLRSNELKIPEAGAQQSVSTTPPGDFDVLYSLT